MPQYLRLKIEAGYYFFTGVTCIRLPIPANGAARRTLRQPWFDVRRGAVAGVRHGHRLPAPRVSSGLGIALPGSRRLRPAAQLPGLPGFSGVMAPGRSVQAS
jgi:hypothetical protein